MSYPSLNASSRDLPPIAPSSRKKLIPKFHRRSSHELPLMDFGLPDFTSKPASSTADPSPSGLSATLTNPFTKLVLSPSRPGPSTGSHSSPAMSGTLRSVASWRRSRTNSTAGSTVTSPSAATGDSSSLRPSRPLRSGPIAPGSTSSRSASPHAVSKNDISSPQASPTKFARKRHSPPALLVPRVPASFDVVLLSHKKVTLPPQPLRLQGVEPDHIDSPGILVQLHIAGLTFILPLDKIERTSSFLLDFVRGCLAMAGEQMEVEVGGCDESDGTYSEVETDDDAQVDPLPSSTGNRYSSDSDLLPPSFAPLPILRASSLDKLTKLGLIPPPVPKRLSFTSSFESASDVPTALTPRAQLKFALRLPPTGPLSTTKSSADSSSPSSSPSTTTFFNILVLRNPEPYAAIAYFFSFGTLLPSLRCQLEGEVECGGCPLCGEVDRARRLREVEGEAKWMGLEALVSLCKAERRRTEIIKPPRLNAKKSHEGWI